MFSIKEIFKESLGFLIFASILSLTAGILLRNIQDRLLVILPLIIVLPALNGMIGNFGIIMTSRITTALYEKKVTGGFHSRIIKHLFREMIPISIFSALFISVLSILIANFRGFDFNPVILWKITLITLTTTISLVFLVFTVSIFGSLYVYKRRIDPDDVLIPITTSIADLGSMAIFSLLVAVLF